MGQIVSEDLRELLHRALARTVSFHTSDIEIIIVHLYTLLFKGLK